MNNPERLKLILSRINDKRHVNIIHDNNDVMLQGDKAREYLKKVWNHNKNISVVFYNTCFCGEHTHSHDGKYCDEHLIEASETEWVEEDY